MMKLFVTVSDRTFPSAWTRVQNFRCSAVLGWTKTAERIPLFVF